MPKEKPPAFQFYPKDFLTDEKVVLMSNTEVGIYVRLLCFCWLEGSLPLDTGSLARMARMPLKHFTKLWENTPVKQCFQMGEDGRLRHKRLDSERQQQDQFRRRQTDAAASRWHMPNPSQADATPVSLALPPQCSPSPSSSPISNLQTPSLPKARDSEDIGDRARELLEHYPRWFAEERKGARIALLGGPLQFAEASKLCEVWDDGRLEKLARIVLTTEDPWIAGTDRGWKIFVMKASWADNLLCAWEAENARTA